MKRLDIMPHDYITIKHEWECSRLQRKPQPNTLFVTMEEMIHHCKAVTRGRDRCMVIGDLPFMSYETSTEEAVRNAGRLVKEGGVDAVRIAERPKKHYFRPKSIATILMRTFH